MSIIRKFLLLSLTCIGITACNSMYEVTLNDRIVYDPFPGQESDGLLADASLQGCLNQLIQQEGIDIESVTLLACPASGVTSLEGIGALKNLEQLELSDNNISSLGALNDLKKLRVLSIRNNQVRDVRALLNLPLLRYISLQGNNNIPCRQLDRLKEHSGTPLSKPLQCNN